MQRYKESLKITANDKESIFQISDTIQQNHNNLFFSHIKMIYSL